jgi:hypothetical protein
MKSPVGGCVICGKKRIERNHVGGKNFVAWFTMPFCPKHHTQFHALVSAARINLEYTTDPVDRLIRALKALLVGAFMLLEAMEELNSCSKRNDPLKVEERISEHV